MSERVLAAGLGDSRPPQLVGEKQQNQCPEGKESPSGRGHDSSLSHVILPMAASSRPVLQAPGSSIQVIIRRCASTFLPGALRPLARRESVETRVAREVDGAAVADDRVEGARFHAEALPARGDAEARDDAHLGRGR